uniref:Ran-binding protein 3 n=1 Tax=Ciona intestinalis TaxID=7719 RepID=F6TVK0_CIOIN|nr:ran-binding protein 3 [Ciona intestinalis]|eukprot:XP_002126767.1 ran-binding protein 3 [Ciona intestinalis]
MSKSEDNKPQENIVSGTWLKRSRADMVGSSTEATEHEPEEKRPAFRLQPPTLIHGQAKPVPKSAEDSTNRCKFLQPSKLTVSSTSGAQHKNDKSPLQPARIGSGLLVSSSNPFLLTANDSIKEEESVKENETVAPPEQTESKQNGGSADTGEKCVPDSTTDKATTKDTKEGNLFLQSTEVSASASDGFVFGKKMEERVTVAAINSDVAEQESGDAGSSVSSSEFVFGQNLAERAKVSSSTDPPSLFMPPSNNEPSGLDAKNDSTNQVETKRGGLEEDAAAHFAASQHRTVIPEVEVVTGEEGEKNVLQMQCKLYQFDAKNQNWLERGVGSLHLNDGICNDGDVNFQSRLVMRTHGSLRLVLNTKVWPQMTVERASKKSVRVSAQTEDGSISVFLISGTINDAEQIYRALEYRVLHQKQLEDQNKEDENPSPTKSNNCGDKDNDKTLDVSKELPGEVTDNTLKIEAAKNTQETTTTT